jgi:DNA repair ATPase RecN
MADAWWDVLWVEWAFLATAGWAWTWWRVRRLLDRYRALKEASDAENSFSEVETWVWTQADERPAEQRAQLRRSMDQMREAVGSGQEASSETNASGMELLEGLASAIGSITQMLAREDETVPRNELEPVLEKLRGLDPTVNKLLENLDGVDASLQAMAGEVERYGSDFDWEALRPSLERLNHLLDGSSSGGRTATDTGQAVQLPPGLAQAIDQAII